MKKMGNWRFFTFKRQFVVKLEKLDNAKYTLKIISAVVSDTPMPGKNYPYPKFQNLPLHIKKTRGQLWIALCACTFSGKKMLHWQENVALARKCCICKKMLQVASRNLLLQKQEFLANATFSCKCMISCH